MCVRVCVCDTCDSRSSVSFPACCDSQGVAGVCMCMHGVDMYVYMSRVCMCACVCVCVCDTCESRSSDANGIAGVCMCMGGVDMYVYILHLSFSACCVSL